MRYLLLCFVSLLTSLSGMSQMGVGGVENLTVIGGTIFSVDSLVFIPTSDYSFGATNLTHNYIPKPGVTPGTQSIARVYYFTKNPPIYTGQIGIVYSDAELAGNAEGLLQIAYQNGTVFTTTAASTVDMVNNYVSYNATNIFFGNVTATTAGVTLPITYRGFSAGLKDQFVLLNWVMEETDDLSHFDIEYSSDGRTWTTASSQNFQAGKKEYSFQHNDLNFSTRYYRIAMVDVNGRKLYTRTATVRNGNAGADLQVVKNGSSIMLYFSGKVPSTVRVFDIKGQLVMTRNVSLQQAEIPKQAAGIYVVSFIVDGQKISRRIQF